MKMDELKLNELVAVAEVGNEEAMVELANYYLREREYGDAFRWAHRAGQRGHTEGAFLTALVLSMRADMVNVSDMEELVDNMRDSYIWAQRAWALYQSSAKGTEEYQKEFILKLCKKREIALAYVLGRNEKYDAVERLLEGDYSHMAKLMRAIHTPPGTEPGDVYKMLQVLKECEKEELTTCWAEDAVELAARLLAFHERDGYNDKQKPNTKEAVRVLQNARMLLTSEKNIEALDKELSFYEKKLFGGWKYIGPD